MLTQEKINVLKPLLADPAFDAEIKNASTYEDFRKIFAIRGVEITEEELNELADSLPSQTEQELDDEDLDKVAGGGIAAGLLIIAGGITIGIGAFGALVNYANKRWGR